MLPKFVSLLVDEGENRYLNITNSAAPFDTKSEWYVYYDKITTEPDYKIGSEADTEADARGKMLIYLLEQGLM
jgi:hypothetical protein